MCFGLILVLYRSMLVACHRQFIGVCPGSLMEIFVAHPGSMERCSGTSARFADFRGLPLISRLQLPTNA